MTVVKQATSLGDQKYTAFKCCGLFDVSDRAFDAVFFLLYYVFPSLSVFSFGVSNIAFFLDTEPHPSERNPCRRQCRPDGICVLVLSNPELVLYALIFFINFVLCSYYGRVVVNRQNYSWMSLLATYLYKDTWIFFFAQALVVFDNMLAMHVSALEIVPLSFRFIVGWIAVESSYYYTYSVFEFVHTGAPKSLDGFVLFLLYPYMSYKEAFDAEYVNVVSLMRHVMHCLSEDDKVRFNEVIEELSVASYHLVVEQMKDPGTWEKDSDSTVNNVSPKALNRLWERFDEVVANGVFTFSRFLPLLTRAVPLMDNWNLSFLDQEEQWGYLVDAAKSRCKALPSLAVEHAKKHILDPEMCDKAANNLYEFSKTLNSESSESLGCDFVF